MNGRCYDPKLGMMLSPDNEVQAADYSPSYNRYSYCLNNPLKYTDPSGESWLDDLISDIGKFIAKTITGEDQARYTNAINWGTGSVGNGKSEVGGNSEPVAMLNYSFYKRNDFEYKVQNLSSLGNNIYRSERIQDYKRNKLKPQIYRSPVK